MRQTMIALIAGITLVLSACGSNQTAGNTPAQATSATPAATTPVDHSTMPGMSGTSAAPMNHGSVSTDSAPYDVLFIDGMIIHHQGAVTMATRALTEATRLEIKTLAQDIITAQKAEIAQLQAWRTSWYPTIALTQGTDTAMSDMQISSDASTPFDQRFIEAMVPHHVDAITMARDAQQNAEHAEIKQLAGGIITAQEAEITQMQQWLKDWYSK